MLFCKQWYISESLSFIINFSTEIGVIIVNECMAVLFMSFLPSMEHWLHRNDNTVSVFKRVMFSTFFNLVILNFLRNLNIEMFVRSEVISDFVEKYANKYPIPFTG